MNTFHLYNYTAYNLLFPPPHPHPRHTTRRGATGILVPRPPQCCTFEIARRHTTLGRTSQDEESARRRDLYLRTHNIYRRAMSMPPAGVETTIPASERPQTYNLDSAETRIGLLMSGKSFFNTKEEKRMKLLACIVESEQTR